MPRGLWPYVVCGQSSNVEEQSNHLLESSSLTFKIFNTSTSPGNIYVKSGKSKVHLFTMMQRNKMVINRDKVSYVRNSGQKRIVSYKYKENKRNCIFRYWLYCYQKCKIEISLILCTELACYNETVQFF